MIHDVAIIGAGPCGLAVAARLCEPSPSALFTDDEHARYWRKFGKRSTIEKEVKQSRSARSGSKACFQSEQHSRPSMVVFDANSDQWISSWRSKFKALRITHLRSPLFFHPDPQDRDGLLAYSHFQGRDDELEEIVNVVGREISKHKQKKARKGKIQCQQTARHLHLDDRDRNDYFTPSSSLFDDYCDHIISRYNLGSLVQKSKILSIKYDYTELPTESSKLFTLTTSVGEIHLARNVVLATGPSSTPCIPKCCPILCPPNSQGSACHIFDPCISDSRFPSHLRAKLGSKQKTKLVVVGGGLTSAQVSHLLLDAGVSKVFLILRGKLKVKHFDVDLPWIAKVRNREMATFWSADSDEERFDMLKLAKGGGSVTPTYKKILQKWEATGKLELCYDSEIETGMSRWDEDSKTWELTLKGSNKTHQDDKGEERKLRGIDHVLFATSVAPDIHAMDCLKGMRQDYPIDSIRGLPKLNDELMWHDEVPLFFTGGLAALRLGPGAANLAGARLGAERIAWGIERSLKRSSRKSQGRAVAGEETRTMKKQIGDERGDASSTLSSENGSTNGYGSESDAEEGTGDGLGEFTGGFQNQYAMLHLDDE